MYASNKQRKMFHSKGAKKKGITPQIVKEFDNASRKPPKRKFKYSPPKKGY